MSAQYINMSGSSVVLEKTNYSRTIEGLERLQETRTCQTSFLPTALQNYANGKTHSTYPNMVVEQTDTSSLSGGLSQFTASYVGLTSNVEPPPIITVTPVADYQFNPVAVTIRFVTNQSDESIAKAYGYKTALPKSPFRGVAFYQSIKEPFFDNGFGQGGATFNNGSMLPVLAINQSLSITSQQYLGMVSTGCFIERYGKYAIVTSTYQDLTLYTTSELASGSYVLSGGGLQKFN